MKAIKILILFFAILLPSSIFAQTRIFSDLSSDKNVQTTFISKTMIQLASGVLGQSSNLIGNSQINIGNVLNSINTIEVVSTEKKKTVKKMQKILDKATKKYDLLPLVEVPDNNQNTKVLAETDNYTGLVTKLFIVNKETSQMQVVVIQGAIDVAQLLSNSTAE